MARFANSVMFTPTAGGTTDFTVSAAVQGFMTPALAGAPSGTYKYRAESADLSQWEIGEGVYTSGTGVLTRATVLYNSAGTGTAAGQSGAGTKINFTVAPNVGMGLQAVADTLEIDNAGSFTTGQKSQARSNIGMADGHIPGEPSNGAAAAGEIGEYISNNATTGSLTTATPTNVTSISLTAGEWDITAGFFLTGGGTTTLTDLWLTIATASATMANTAGQAFRTRGFTRTDPAEAGALGPLRVTLSVTTTYYLNVQASFGGTAPNVTGLLRARRVR